MLGVCLGGVSFYVWSMTKFLQQEMLKKLEDNDKRIENITIGLINAIRDCRMDIKYLKGYVTALKKSKDKNKE